MITLNPTQFEISNLAIQHPYKILPTGAITEDLLLDGIVCQQMNSSTYHKIKRSSDDQLIASKSLLSRYYEDPEAWNMGAPFKITDSMKMGSVLDAMLLDHPEKENFVKKKYKAFNTAESKAWRDSLLAEGKTILTDAECNDITEGISGIARSEDARNLLGSSVSQVAMFAPLEGYPCKCLSDIVPMAGSQFSDGLADLKRTNGPHPNLFRYTAKKLKYHWQAAKYLDLWNEIQRLTGGNDYRHEFYFLVSSDSYPFGAGVCKMNKELIEEGRTQYRKALKQFRHAMLSGVHENIYNAYDGILEI